MKPSNPSEALPDVLRSSAFGLLGPKIRHGFSTRSTGVPHEGQAGSALAGFMRAARFPADCRGLLLHQVHGANVLRVEAAPAAATPAPAADGAVTRLPGVALAVRTADCVPILLADAAAPVVGVTHAGWRGAVAGVVENTVTAMVEAGATPEGLVAAIGPAIGPCCFEVGEDVAAPFEALDPSLVGRADGRPRVNLPAAAALLLRRAGLLAGNVSGGAPCTRCHPERFYSHRGENGRTGRLLSVVALAPGGGRPGV